MNESLAGQEAYFEQLVYYFEIHELVSEFVLKKHILRDLMKAHSLLGILYL